MYNNKFHGLSPSVGHHSLLFDQGFLKCASWDWSERHLTVFCINEIVPGYVVIRLNNYDMIWSQSIQSENEAIEVQMFMILRQDQSFIERSLSIKWQMGVATTSFPLCPLKSGKFTWIKFHVLLTFTLTRSNCKKSTIYTANVYRDLQGINGEIKVRGFQIYWDCMLPGIPVIFKVNTLCGLLISTINYDFFFKFPYNFCRYFRLPVSP